MSHLVAALLLVPATSLVCAAQSSPALAAARQIYRCEIAGVATFSDRPCGTAAHPYDVDPSRVSLLEASVPPGADKAASVGPSAGHRAALPRQDDMAATDAKAEVCRRLQRSLTRIASRMRAGYTARTGERLKAQRRELQAKRRARRC